MRAGNANTGRRELYDISTAGLSAKISYQGIIFSPAILDTALYI